MDNNNPVTPVQPLVPPVQAQPTAPNPAMNATMPPVAPQPTIDPVSSGENGGSSKKIILLVVGLLVLSLAVGAFYFYSTKADKPAVVTPSPASTTSNSLDSLDADLEAIDASSPDDLSTIDQDLKNL